MSQSSARCGLTSTFNPERIHVYLPPAIRYGFHSILPHVCLPPRDCFPHSDSHAGLLTILDDYRGLLERRLPFVSRSVADTERAGYTRVTFPLCHEPFRSAHESDVSGILTSSPYLIAWTRAISVSGERRTTCVRFSSVPHREYI